MHIFWVIAKKDIREALRSRSTYLYLVVLLVLSFSYFSSYGAHMQNVLSAKPSPEAIRQASQSLLDSFVSTLPMMFSIWICTIFATYSVVVEKSKRNVESLLVTPISLNQFWLGKSLAVTLPSVIVGLGASILVYIAMNVMKTVPQTGSFLFPGPLAIISAVILVPLLIFAIVSLVIYLQLTIANPRFANFIFLGLFFLLYFGINFLAGNGMAANFLLIYLGVAAICGLVAYLLSRHFTKERVILSSKEQ